MSAKTERTITIVSDHRETLDGVAQYLGRVGVATLGMSRLEDAEAKGADADAIVLFADDYPRAVTLNVFARLRARRPTLLLVIVTEDVDAFASPATDTSHVVVLRRPAWGWMIVDAIRGVRGDPGSNP